MNELVNALKGFGISVRILSIVIIIVGISVVYKNILETEKINLEIKKLKKETN